MSEAGRVEQQYLVIRDKTALPPRCIKTNQPVTEEEYRAWELPWLPSGLRIIMLIAPFFLLFAPMMTKSCRLKAGISRSANRHYQIRKLLAVTLILAAIIIVPVGFALRSIPIIVYGSLSFVFLFWGGFILLILFSSPLKIVRHENDQFWISGCSPEYLENLAKI